MCIGTLMLRTKAKLLHCSLRIQNLPVQGVKPPLDFCIGVLHLTQPAQSRKAINESTRGDVPIPVCYVGDVHHQYKEHNTNGSAHLVSAASLHLWASSNAPFPGSVTLACTKASSLPWQTLMTTMSAFDHTERPHQPLHWLWACWGKGKYFLVHHPISHL